MKSVISSRALLFLMISILVVCINTSLAQNTGKNERFNLAVYATGTQNDQPLSANLLTVVQNKTITKLTVEGDYQLIERSGEFLKEIQSEHKMQQSGEVADGQIAEIGAGYGAEKVCVVSVTIINKYLYIATRIVDVSTKTSYESGDSEVNNYKDIPVLTKTLDVALIKMLSIAQRNHSSSNPAPPPQNEPPTKVINSTQPTSTEQIAPIVPSQTVTSQISDNNPSNQNTNQTVAEAKAQAAREKAEAKAETKQAKTDFNAYKKQVIKEKGGFLDVNSLAYKEYRKHTIYKSVFIPIGVTLIAGSLTYLGFLCGIETMWDEIYGLFCYPVSASLFYPGVAAIIAGSIIANKHLKKSYNYYLNGDRRTVSWQITPYLGGNNTFGAGLSLRF